ncbi:hypothetical protein HORIV_14990 [Vreelandella olivaria]|uniref:Uncharacterized protein n=1 Tax=Vreelandella olivaria TaxID=390919 RepID=A0ABM7GF63_9GAMM|nr:hypothetical protein HORIV_14990 [Halomonas olivaria]
MSFYNIIFTTRSHHILCSPERGINAMQHLVTPAQAFEADVMEVWAKRALQQRAALDAIKAYLR